MTAERRSSGQGAGRAAFFRVEGALTSRTAGFTAAWLAANSQQVTHRLTRLGAVALAAPLQLADDPALSARVAFMGLRGMSEDRLEVLGEEFHETWLRHALRPVGVDLVARARQAGRRVILVSDNVDVVVRHLAAALGADEVVCNRLEVRNGRVTGRLFDPVVGRLGGERLREWARARGVDLAASCGYGASAVDSTLLSALGLPCAVQPDRALRRIARDLDWPVVEG